jgi:hypothetical protein
MIEATIQPTTSTHDDDVKRRLSRLNAILIAMFATILIVPAVGSWWVARQLPIVDTVKIDNLKAESPTDLCPGESLIVSYDFHAKGEGVLVRDWTAWYVTPPKTMIFSMSRRFILDGPIDQHLVETWTIPAAYFDYETEHEQPLPPGEYRRYVAISSPSRSTVIAIASLPFSIRADCPF